MIVSQAKWRVLSALAGITCVLAWQASGQAAAAVKRVYVEPFSIKDNRGNLREDVIEQLRKLRSIAVVSDRATADAVLSGKGEIWVKGYQSLNPRSGRLPSNGTPLYSGFLSVELKDPTGDTLWSYLVTPAGAGSSNIQKDLSRQVARHLADALSADEPETPHR